MDENNKKEQKNAKKNENKKQQTVAAGYELPEVKNRAILRFDFIFVMYFFASLSSFVLF